MGYKGLPFNIEFGAFGIHTDDPQSKLNPGELIFAMNIGLEEGKLEKATGSSRYNETALSSGIVGTFDWWPDSITQQLIAVTRSGLVYQMPDTKTNILMASTDTSPVTNLLINGMPCLVAGGSESQSRNRKLFILSGNDPVQVISGNSLTRRTISKPSADWSGRNQPRFGLIHHNRLMVWGCPNNPHQAYASNPDDHEDFQTFGGKALNFTVYPGEYQYILSGFVHKGRLFWGKYPRGIYYLDDSDPNTANWNVYKFADAIGAASGFPSCEVLDDLLIANQYGSVTSFKAVQYYGGFEMADVLRNQRSSKFVRDYMSISGLLVRQAIYYSHKKLAFFSYQSSAGILADRLLVIDFNKEQPRIYWYDKDQPNCLGLRKSLVSEIEAPFYGSEDGYIYLMDQENRDVGGQAYSMVFMTPSMDLRSMSPDMASKQKHFDFLSIDLEQTGKWTLDLEIYIDGRYSEAIPVGWATKKGLGEHTLNVDRFYTGTPNKVTVPLHGTGKSIAIRGSNSSADENIKLLSMTVWFRPAGLEQTEDES